MNYTILRFYNFLLGQKIPETLPSTLSILEREIVIVGWTAAVTLIQSKCKTMARVTVIHHIVSLSPSVLVYYLFISVSGLKT